MDRFLSMAAISGFTLVSFLSGCGENPQSSNAGSLKLSIKAISGTLPKAAGSQAQQVTITTAKVVLDEIEIESTGGDSLDFESASPLVVNLNLTGALTELSTVTLPFGTYEELELKIDKLDSTDGAVFVDNPDLQNRSVFVQGFVDGDPNAVFVFSSDLEAEQKQEFSPPLVVDANSPTSNIVLAIDTRIWFSDGAGGFLDPRESQNQGAIARNIRASIAAFEDENDDGEDDDAGSGDDDEDEDGGPDDDGEDGDGGHDDGGGSGDD